MLKKMQRKLLFWRVLCQIDQVEFPKVSPEALDFCLNKKNVSRPQEISKYNDLTNMVNIYQGFDINYDLENIIDRNVKDLCIRIYNELISPRLKSKDKEVMQKQMATTKKYYELKKVVNLL